MSSFDHVTLLEHHDFLRRLARGLVDDDAAADDLTQETWLRALRVPPRHGDTPRPWLATVARNLARNRRRGDARRRDREAEVALAEGASVDERADRSLELQGDVVQALERLDEPYRNVLFLRYFEDKGPAAIAAELGVPLETVRSRLKRGLARMRTDLDARHSGLRSAWSLPLSAFVEPGSARAASGLTSSGTWSGGWIVMSILTVCGVVTLSTLAWLGGERAASPSVGGGNEGESGVAVSTPGEARASQPAEAGSAPTGAVAAPQGERREVGSAAFVRGGLRLPDGSPAAGMPVVLELFPVEPEGEGPRAALEEIVRVEGRTQASGTFELRVDLDKEHGGLVRTEPEGFVRASWPRVALSRGDTRELGELTLMAAGAVRLALVDANGEPLDAAGWKASATSMVRLPGRDRPGFAKSESFPGGAGELTLSGIPPATTSLRVSHPAVRRQLEAQVAVRAGESAEVTLTYGGPSPASCLAVELVSREGGASPSTAHVRLIGGDGPISAERDGPVGPYFFSGLEPGAHVVECTDPNFLPWRETLQTGALHRARVVGAASLRVEAVDAASGERLEVSGLELAPDLRRFAGGMTMQPRPFRVEVAATDGSLVIDDLLPGAYAYTLTTAEHGPRRGRLPELRAGVETRLRLELGDAPQGLGGVVVTVGDGAPVADVEVQVTRGERAGHDLGPNSNVMDMDGPVPPILKTTRTDAAGRFGFPTVDAGRWTLRVKRGPWFQVDRTVTHAAGDEPVRFAIPPGSMVRGSVRLPAGVPPDTIGIEAAEEGDEGFGPAMGPLGVQRVQLDEEGRFEIGPFPPGVWTLRFGLCGPSTPGPRPGMEFPGSWAEFHEENVRVEATEAAPLALDLRELVPAALSLDLGESDVRSTDVTTWVWDVADPTARLRGSSGLQISRGPGLATNEPVDLGAFAPGAYRLAVIDRRGSWAAVLPDTIRLQVATPRVVRAEIVLEPGTLELLDAATGEPLADVDVTWEVGLPAEGFRRRRLKPWSTDGDGRCDLRVPAGAYELAVEGYAPVTIQWPPADGGTVTARLTATE